MIKRGPIDDTNDGIALWWLERFKSPFLIGDRLLVALNYIGRKRGKAPEVLSLNRRNWIEFNDQFAGMQLKSIFSAYGETEIKSLANE